VGDSRAVYTYVPFSKPVHVQKNSKQSFCVHTNKKTGLVVRRKINFGGDNPDPYFAEWREVSRSRPPALAYTIAY